MPLRKKAPGLRPKVIGSNLDFKSVEEAKIKFAAVRKKKPVRRRGKLLAFVRPLS